MYEIKNLFTISTIAKNYQGQKGKGVSKTYMTSLLAPYILNIDGYRFVDITKLPKEIKDKIDI